MKVVICNFIHAQLYEPKEPTLAIRIFDPNCVHHPECKDGFHSSRDADHNVYHPLQPSENWVKELTYSFHDVDPIRALLEGNEEEAKKRFANPDLPKLETALKMREEFKEALALYQPTRILAHCWAGMSRSVATVKALCEHEGYPIEWASFDGRHNLMAAGHTGNLWLYKMIRSGTDKMTVPL